MKNLLFAALLFLMACNMHETVEPAHDPDRCMIATPRVLARNVKVDIHTNDNLINVRMPYQGYHLEYTVSEDQFPCFGLSRGLEDMVVEIWDSRYHCAIFIPKLETPDL
jgi:hypothetical protein